MLGGREAFLKQCSSVNASCRAGLKQKKVLLNTHKKKPVNQEDRALQVGITIADGASYLAGCAKDFKTSAEASRITAEWMPRATAPCAPGDHDETGLCRISCSGLTTRYMRRVEQDASSRRHHLYKPACKAPTVRGAAVASAA